VHACQCRADDACGTMAADPAGEPPGAADPDVAGAAPDELGLLAAADVPPDVQADRPAAISNAAAKATADVLVRETDMGSILPHRRHRSVRACAPDTVAVFAIGRAGPAIGGYGGTSPRETTVRGCGADPAAVSSSGRGPWEPPTGGQTQQNPSRWGFVGISSVMTARHHGNTRRRYFDTHRCNLPLWATRFGKRYTTPNFFSRQGQKSDTVSRNPTSESSVILLSVRTLLRG
jgi:hypothetical protein